MTTGTNTTTATTTTSSSNNNIILLDAEVDALTVSWPATTGTNNNNTTHDNTNVRYILQYRKASSSNDNNEDDSSFVTLSENLKTTQVRKKNLTNDNNGDDGVGGYYFRVKARDSTEESSSSSWTTHDQPFTLLTTEEASTRMEPPTVTSGGSSFAAIISWKKQDSGDNSADDDDNAKNYYEIQMRQAVGGAPWITIAPALGQTQVKKKNLTSIHGYQFRVRPVESSSSSTTSTATNAFSPPSATFVGVGLSPGMNNLFRTLEKGTLLSNGQKTSSSSLTLENALGGKEFILLYASASWCGPCRSFSPMLKQWYQSLGPNRPIEVVFLSADHDENGFQHYYAGMPWLAVNFEEDTREELMSFLRVTGIPQLAVLDGRTGRIVESNAVGKPLDIQRWRSLCR